MLKIETPTAKPNAQCAVALVVLALTIVVGATAANAQKYCWKPSELRATPGEAQIQKNTQAAFRRVPNGVLGKRSSGASRTGKVLRRVQLPPGRKLVALTFDLCEQPYEISGYQGGVVDFLRAEGVPATFFASGKWLVTHPERASQLMGDPLFEIGNHAWEHRNFQVLSRPRMKTEIGAAQLAYQRTYDRLRDRACLGRDGRPAHRNASPVQRLFRFPFGACTPAAIEAVEEQGLLAIQWDVSSSDPWRGQTVSGMIETVVRSVRPGSIVLFHANGRGWKTGDALPGIIRELRARGYEFATVSQLLRVGQPVFSGQCYDSRPGDVDRYQKLSRRLEKAYDAFYARFGGHRPQLPTSAHQTREVKPLPPRSGGVPAARPAGPAPALPTRKPFQPSGNNSQPWGGRAIFQPD